MSEDLDNVVPFPEGRYESLVTEGILERLQALSDNFDFKKQNLEPDEKQDAERQQALAYALQQYLFAQTATIFSKLNGIEQLELVREIVEVLYRGHIHSEMLAAPLTQLRSVARRTTLRNKEALHLADPLLPLTAEDLIINAAGEYSLNEHLRSEMDSADSIDLLCAFIKFSGIKVLEDQLAKAKRRGVPIRVLTTTYLGATDQKALDELVERFGAEVRINYETHSTRLHAKAWLFTRNSKYHTGYIGSSNLSQDALVDGLEWNVRLAEGPSKGLLDKFRFTFQSYWDDPRFEPYDPEADGERLALQLFEAGGCNKPSILNVAIRRQGEVERASRRSVQPYSHQRKILAALQIERNRGASQNLVVAATGTGKTVVAALDYRRLCEEAGHSLRLLFVAHRSEILRQAQQTFATVMSDPTFGERFVGGSTS